MDDLQDGLIKHNIPQHMWESVRNYIEHGFAPGGFLYAVLTNNLADSFNKGDMLNAQSLGNYVRFMWWEIDSDAWGSPEKVDAWIKKGGSLGHESQGTTEGGE